MEVFKKLNAMLGEGSTLTLTIAKKGEQLTVAVLPGNSLVKDNAKSNLVPLNLVGTADELDAGFLDAISTPISKTIGLLTDMAAYEKAEEEAKAKSKMEAERKAAEDKRKKDVADWIDLAKTNLSESKYRDASTCLANARKQANDKEVKSIESVEADIAKATSSTLFGGDAEDKSDGKNIKIGGKPTKAKATKVEPNEEEEE